MQEIVRAFAPGRVEFIGNHTDYNGGQVLGAALTCGITLTASRREDREIHLWSGAHPTTVRATLDAAGPRSGVEAWANYPLGVLDELLKAGMKAVRGFNMRLESNLPEGAGLSSSAALEVGSALVLCRLYDFSLPPLELARLGRRAENRFVGVPCGLLDQGVSVFGKADHLVHLDCKVEAIRPVRAPHGLALWLFNTRKKHSLVDSLYATRHAECREAWRLLAPRHPGAQVLCDLTPEAVAAAEDFLPPVPFRRARHVTAENQRVVHVLGALERGDLTAVGRLLRQSHESSRDLFENSIPELDFLVETLCSAPGVYGARLSGGGFGGSVLAMTGPSFSQESALAVEAAYQAQFKGGLGILSSNMGNGGRLLEA